VGGILAAAGARIPGNMRTRRVTSTAERYHFKTENCAIPRQRSAKASPACRDAVEMGRRTAFSPYRELCWLNDTGVNVTPSGRSSKVTEKDFESSFSRFCA